MLDLLNNKNTALIDTNNHQSVKHYIAQNVASNAPPDDAVGEVMPLTSFTLTEGNNILQEADKITSIINRLPSHSYIQKNNLKIKTINNIPTGIIKI